MKNLNNNYYRGYENDCVGCEIDKVAEELRLDEESREWCFYVLSLPEEERKREIERRFSDGLHYVDTDLYIDEWDIEDFEDKE